MFNLIYIEYLYYVKCLNISYLCPVFDGAFRMSRQSRCPHRSFLNMRKSLAQNRPGGSEIL